MLEEMECHHPFLIMDRNTKAAAGERVERILERAQIPATSFVYETERVLPPTEEQLGKVIMHWDPHSDGILAIGSGVIGDLSKLVSRATGFPYLLMLTAPSMDGMVSPTSSMDVAGLKVSLPSATAWAVVADLDVLSHSPRHMIASGLGDMLAKYISLTEWKLSHLIDMRHLPSARLATFTASSAVPPPCTYWECTRSLSGFPASMSPAPWILWPVSAMRSGRRCWHGMSDLHRNP